MHAGTPTASKDGSIRNGVDRWQNPTSLILLFRVNIKTSGRYAEMQELWQEDPMVYGFQKPFVAPKLEGLKFFPFRDAVPRMCGQLE